MADGDSFLGDSECARLIREHDWSATLGPVASWPGSLLSTVNLMLRSPVPLVLLWGAGGIMLYNDAYSGFAGRRHPRLLGSKVREGWPEVADFNDNVMKVCLAGGTLSYSDQPLVLYRSGLPERIWCDLGYSPVIDESGAPGGVIAIVVETTDRVLATQSANFLDALGKATATARDADEILAITTRMTAEYLGLSNCAYADMDEDQDGFTIRGDWAAPGSPSIVGHYRLADFGRLAVGRLSAGLPLVINDNLREIAPEEAAAFQAIGIAATICMPLVKAGRLTALMAIHDKDPHHWSAHELLVIREVTERSWAHIERVRAEAELRELNATLESRVQERTEQLGKAEEALRQAQKMEAVGQLTGGLAHDFNNLLAGISGSLEMIERRIGEGRFGGLDRYISAAQGASRRAASLTQRLLAFSRRQTLDPRPLDVNRLIAGMEDLIRRSVGPDVNVTVAGAEDLWLTKVDAPQLENALLNLCINARDAMALAGGCIRITAENRMIEGSLARERDLADGPYIVLRVADTGSGMTQDVISRAFDPFFTTKPIGEGTGLGLSMVYGFARQSGGHVRIDSQPGQGTTVSIYLPRFGGELERDEVLPQDVLLAGGGAVVLVVDDEPTIRMLALEVLEESGYRTLEAGDGASALRILQSDAKIDLLVTDVGLPGGMNGRQVADAARVSRPDLRVLFMTGYAENAVIRGGNLPDGMELISKPFVMTALVKRIEELLQA